MQASEHAAPSGHDTHGTAQGHGVGELDAPAHGQADHGQAGHESAGHGSGHGGGEHHQEFNWFHGLIGAKEGVEPSLLWRTPDMPTPFAALLINTALLFGFLFKFARGPVAKGLADRRQRIMRGIDEASAMKAEAEKQLAFYRSKIENLDAEIERVKREMREGAELERKRILEDAAARRIRLEQEARTLIDQELKAVRDELTRETAKAALSSARDLLAANTTTDDHRRLCEQYLDSLRPDQSLTATSPRRVERSVRSETT
jgi:F0F1-type ATP synthase membrane subunit b/b'